MSLPPVMAACLPECCRRLWAAWMSVQVEFQGRYSVERFEQLEVYMGKLGVGRLLLLCLLTPLPCLVLALLKEVPTLAPPEAGVYKNWVFFVRSWFVLGFIGGCVLVQMGQTAPRLKLTGRQIVLIAQLASTAGVAVGFAFSVLVAFPVPFGLLVVAPPDIVVIIACVIYISGPRWRADPTLRSEMRKQISVFICQVALTFIYPLYIYGFVSLSGVEQTMFVIVLPIIKILAKNWISRTLTDDDQKPETVVFNVEVFHALYASTALQSATSWTSTALIIVVDVLQFWESMLDVVDVLKGIRKLMTKIPRGHSVSRENFMQVAMRLMIIETGQTTGSRNHSADALRVAWRTRVEAWLSSKNRINKSSSERNATPATILERGRHSWRIVPRRAQIFPIRPPRRRKWLQSRVHVIPDTPMIRANELKVAMRARDSLGLETIFSRKERALFLQKSMRVLFITEYLLLVEYVEVVVPFVYCLHRIALFYMPNSVYYPSLLGLSCTDLYSSVINVLAYGSLEFTSLLFAIVVLKRSLGFSPLSQLAFVLEMQAGMIQSKLNVWTVYITQMSLAHLGADFSFQFAWLQTQPKS